MLENMGRVGYLSPCLRQATDAVFLALALSSTGLWVGGHAAHVWGQSREAFWKGRSRSKGPLTCRCVGLVLGILAGVWGGWMDGFAERGLAVRYRGFRQASGNTPFPTFGGVRRNGPTAHAVNRGCWPGLLCQQVPCGLYIPWQGEPTPTQDVECAAHGMLDSGR